MSFFHQMPLPPSIRSLIFLSAGVVVGAVGATLFQDSMPGAEGSLQERANKLEMQLREARNRIAALEAADAAASGSRVRRNAGGSRAMVNRRGSDSRTLADGARIIAEDIREGRPVNPDDIFRASKPLLRDLAPLFDRIRLKQQQQRVDTLTGELARKYHLTSEKHALLQQWFEEKANEEAKRWTELVTQDQTRVEDMMRASRDIHLDDGLDTFMGTILPADKFAAFKTDRLAERAERVQQEADMKVQRLDSIVGLDEKQRDQLFGVIARSSHDYDPAMRLEGAAGEIGPGPGGTPQDAMLALLRPEQRAAYEAEQQRRRAEAAKHFESIGLTLPAAWQMLDESDFK